MSTTWERVPSIEVRKVEGRRGDRIKDDVMTGAKLEPPDSEEVKQSSPWIDPEKVKEICEIISQHFIGATTRPTRQVEELVKEAYEFVDEIYGIDAAVQWAEGFKVPAEAVARDLRIFRAEGNSIENMARGRLAGIRQTRLSEDRVGQCISADNPERERLLGLAGGMRVPLPADFQPNGQFPRVKLRTLYLKTQSAVNKMLYSLYEQQLAIILPREEVEKSGVAYHTSMAHWTTSKDKASGRPLFDSKDESRGSALNGRTAKRMAEEIWGIIEHPTIIDIVDMIMSFWRRECKVNPGAIWGDIILWKMDLRGAYTLLSFDPRDAHFFGMELSDDLLIFFLCGVFGWSCTPFAFQVVSRALLFELRSLLAGMILIYVDDLMGVCWKKDLQSELSIARLICTSLLGPTAVSDTKTQSGRRLDIIGYLIDLDKGLVSIARKNFLKALYGFFSVNIEGTVPLKVMQKLQSWSSRYSFICRFMRPFHTAFNRAIRHCNNQAAQLSFKPECKRAVRFWRAMLTLVALDEEKFTKSIHTFTFVEPRLYIQSDACLFGLGILIYGGPNRDIPMGGSAIDISQFGFGTDSSFQNVSEFVAAVMGTIMIIKMGLLFMIKDMGVGLRGDSITAITWITKERYRGESVSNAAMVYTLLGIACGSVVSEATHLSAANNWRADDLSRLSVLNKSLPQLMKEMDYEKVPIVDLMGDEIVMRLLQFMDPNWAVESDEEFKTFWTGVNGTIQQLLCT